MSEYHELDAGERVAVRAATLVPAGIVSALVIAATDGNEVAGLVAGTATGVVSALVATRFLTRSERPGRPWSLADAWHGSLLRPHAAR